MQKINSILVVVERSTDAHQALAKAFVLGRHFGARLELFLCDAEHAYALRTAYTPVGVEAARAQCLHEARQYLESLRQSIAAVDVKVDVDVACESPLYEGIVRKVLASRPDLVVKSIGGNGGTRRGTLSTTDWHLIRTCPAPLLLTRGRPWSPTPRFVAAIDVSADETPGLSDTILRTAGFLASGCGAGLDLMCSRHEGSPEPGAMLAALRALARPYHVADDRIHLLEGEPDATLPRFAGENAYDLLALGALTHRRLPSALVGTLTDRLVNALDCDFLLVKPLEFAQHVYGEPCSARSPSARSSSSRIDAPALSRSSN